MKVHDNGTLLHIDGIQSDMPVCFRYVRGIGRYIFGACRVMSSLEVARGSYPEEGFFFRHTGYCENPYDALDECLNLLDEELSKNRRRLKALNFNPYTSRSLMDHDTWKRDRTRLKASHVALR